MSDNLYGINSTKMQSLISEIENVNVKIKKTLNQISEQVAKTATDFDMPAGEIFREHHRNLEVYYSQISDNINRYADNLRLALQLYEKNVYHNADIFKQDNKREE